MGDMGDYWRDVKSHFREKDRKREDALHRFGLEKIRKSIEAEGLTISEFGDYPPKWRVSNAEGSWTDYWPTTGRIYSGKHDIDDFETDWDKVGKTIAKALKK